MADGRHFEKLLNRSISNSNVLTDWHEIWHSDNIAQLTLQNQLIHYI